MNLAELSRYLREATPEDLLGALTVDRVSHTAERHMNRTGDQLFDRIVGEVDGRGEPVRTASAFHTGYDLATRVQIALVSQEDDVVDWLLSDEYRDRSITVASKNCGIAVRWDDGVLDSRECQAARLVLAKCRRAPLGFALRTAYPLYREIDPRSSLDLEGCLVRSAAFMAPPETPEEAQERAQIRVAAHLGPGFPVLSREGSVTALVPFGDASQGRTYVSCDLSGTAPEATSFCRPGPYDALAASIRKGPATVAGKTPREALKEVVGRSQALARRLAEACHLATFPKDVSDRFLKHPPKKGPAMPPRHTPARVRAKGAGKGRGKDTGQGSLEP